VLWLIVDEVHVATIAIHPDFRRQGIGTALLLHALGAASPEGARSAHLEVRASNSSAQDLYRKLGFAETARAPRYYKDNGEDAVLMALPALNAAMPVGNRASG
jgi:ribosomal-protein-alanine N-acetyltransferase